MKLLPHSGFALLLAASTCLPAVTNLSTQAATRPNIVFIFSDDHGWQAISAYAESRKLIQTPNIDRLAEQGMRFDRCLVTDSLCGPSRATVLTGTYNHINGFYNNGRCRFDGSQPTFPKLLHKAGYQTAIVGKWHLVSDPIGFDYWNILPGQGQYYNPPMIQNGQRMNHEGYVTTIITDLALDWLKHRDASKPFLLMLHQKAPHRAWEPDTQMLDFDHGRKYAEPTTLFDDYSGRGAAEHEQNMTISSTLNEGDLKLKAPRDTSPDQLKAWNAYYDPRNAAFESAHLEGKELVRWKYQRYLHDYLACVASVDRSVGRVLDYLKDNGLETNTIVVYSSDQGMFLGEHNWFDKRWIFEESLRTPLLIRWPGVVKPGSVDKHMVSNLDFAETFLDAAGVPVPARMQGRSLLPLLTGQSPPDWRTNFYYHYYEYPNVHNVPRQYGVVTERYKLVRFYKIHDPAFDYTELFDLQRDPNEMKSVYGDPEEAAVVSGLKSELTRLETELKVPAKDPSGSLLPPRKKGNRKP